MRLAFKESSDPFLVHIGGPFSTKQVRDSQLHENILLAFALPTFTQPANEPNPPLLEQVLALAKKV
jgi:hypothetical protein